MVVFFATDLGLMTHLRTCRFGDGDCEELAEPGTATGGAAVVLGGADTLRGAGPQRSQGPADQKIQISNGGWQGQLAIPRHERQVSGACGLEARAISTAHEIRLKR